MDVEAIDLQSDRIKIFLNSQPPDSNLPSTKRKKPPARVPKLDFQKIFEWRDMQNAEEEEEEHEFDEGEFEEEDDVYPENKHYFTAGTEIQSNASQA